VDEPREYPVPVASDEDVAAFIARYGTPYDPETDDYHRDPFVADIREGKNDPTYNAHSYHTKVPPRAIIPYILHYTEPGDIILDPFCGSGMTGVAAMISANPPKDLLDAVPGSKIGGRRTILNDLSPAACHIAYNYCTGPDPSLMKGEFDRLIASAEKECEGIYDTFHLEPARGIYDPNNFEVSVRLCETSEHLLLKDLEPKSSAREDWVLVSRGEAESMLGSKVVSESPLPAEVFRFIRMPASIVYTVWSDVYRCEGMITVEEHGAISRKTGKTSLRKVRRPRGCGAEIILWEVAVDLDAGKVHESFRCPKCDQIWEKTQIKRIDVRPVLVVYRYMGLKHRIKDNRVVSVEFVAQRPPTTFDLEKIEDAKRAVEGAHVPNAPIDVKGPQYNRNALSARKVTLLADFYSPRNLLVLASFWNQQKSRMCDETRATSFLLTSVFGSIERLTRFRFGRGGNGWLPGQLYFPSLSVEENVFDAVKTKTPRIIQLYDTQRRTADGLFDFAVSCGDAGGLRGIPDDSIDYIFCDPPFGSNIYYSEVNWLYECWLGRRTDREPEAVVHRKNDRGTKSIESYSDRMCLAFLEMFRVLKPGRFATIEFNNSDGRVFEAIKHAVRDAGFSIENMVFLDKVQKTFKQSKGGRGEEDVVGHDVIFNLMKPLRDCSDRRSTVNSAYITYEQFIVEIVRSHLKTLPDRIGTAPQTYSDEHRTTPFLNTMLMTTLIPRGVNVERLNLPFIESVCSRYFKKIDNRWYLPEQVVGPTTNGKLFNEEVNVSDEASAIQWLRQRLGTTPMRIGELRPHWMKATVKLTGELSTQIERLLRENLWLDRSTRRWRIPTDDELAELNNHERQRACHDAERFLEGKLSAPPTDADILGWIERLYSAAGRLEEESHGLVEPGEEPVLPDEALAYYRMMPRLFQSVLKEKVDAAAYTRASRQCRTAARKVQEHDTGLEDAGSKDPSGARQGRLFD